MRAAGGVRGGAREAAGASPNPNPNPNPKPKPKPNPNPNQEREKQPELAKLVRCEHGLALVVCSTRRRCEMVAYLLQGEGITDLVQPERLKPKEREAALQARAPGEIGRDREM